VIRFVDLGKQLEVNEEDLDAVRSFAFFDTVGSRFLSFEGQQVFESWEDLLEMMEDVDSSYIRRVTSLIPAWVPRGKPTVSR